MAELKTKKTEVRVEDFVQGIADETRRKDCQTLVELMRQATGAEPKMWGPSMVGFGSYHYKYASGREGDWFLTGFSPRKQDLTLYIVDGFPQHADLMAKLGKHKTGKSCLYVKKLADLDLTVLAELVRVAAESLSARSAVPS
jgi:hypothetical protein